MELFKIGFVPVTLVDLLDISVVASLLYFLYRSFRRSVVLQGLLLVLIGYLVFWLADTLKMSLLSKILGEFLRFGIFGIIVIFAPELKRIIVKAINNSPVVRLRKILSQNISLNLDIDELIEAIKNLAASRTGALIVIERNSNIDEYIQSGDEINATLSQRLITSIFHPKSPLHDGAIIIKNNSIVSARSVLPVSDDPDIPPELGLRHRSALGISEVSDAAAIVVSEETGKVSVAVDGRIKRNLSEEELRRFILNLFDID